MRVYVLSDPNSAGDFVAGETYEVPDWRGEGWIRRGDALSIPDAKRRGFLGSSPESAVRTPPENAARRTSAPEPRESVCGASLSSGGRCSRQAEGRCWQHEES